jgi:hypothetical protein
MEKKLSKSSLGIVVILGAVWGLSEAALGMGLRSCASVISGSVMTGVALFFMAACWAVSQSFSGIILLVVIASLFKMFDALLLSLPILHGAVGNPIFAFFMEGIAFIVIISLVKGTLLKKTAGQAAAGGLAALMAVNLFPLVKYATGIPACVVAGTGYPLSLYYAYVAVSFSLITVPLGLWAGAKIRLMERGFAAEIGMKRLNEIATPAAVFLCLAIIVLIRLI